MVGMHKNAAAISHANQKAVTKCDCSGIELPTFIQHFFLLLVAYPKLTAAMGAVNSTDSFFSKTRDISFANLKFMLKASIVGNGRKSLSKQ
jgi:hypothetical protein